MRSAPRTRTPHRRAASPVSRSEQAMSETLRIAPATTIGTWGDLRVYLISGSRMINELLKPFTKSKRVWTLTSLWTHRTRPQRLGNLQTVFHKRPRPSSFLEEETRTEERPARNSATQLFTKSDHVQTKPTVTHVPGLICHPCPRPFIVTKTAGGRQILGILLTMPRSLHYIRHSIRDGWGW
jgi:hypothetical protein